MSIMRFDITKEMSEKVRRSAAVVTAGAVMLSSGLAMTGCSAIWYKHSDRYPGYENTSTGNTDGNDSSTESRSGGIGLHSGEIADAMYSDKEYGAIMHVVKIDGELQYVEYNTTLDTSEWKTPGIFWGIDSLEEGKLYELTVDATFVSGGIAGFRHDPQDATVTACREASWNDINLEDIREYGFGFVSIGDYADGDVILALSDATVWKNNKILYRYSDSIESADGLKIYLADGATEKDAQDALKSGEFCTEKCFTMPVR